MLACRLWLAQVGATRLTPCCALRRNPLQQGLLGPLGAAQDILDIDADQLAVALDGPAGDELARAVHNLL